MLIAKLDMHNEIRRDYMDKSECKEINLHWKLFSSTFFLSAFTLGGGYVIVPLMKKKFVEEYGWLAEKEMLDLVAIAQSAPGPIAINASILVGYRLLGFRGALVSVLGTVLPPFLTLSVISFFYLEFKQNATVGKLLKGMSIGVAVVVVDVVINMVKDIIKQKNAFGLLVMLLAFIATLFFKIDLVFIIILFGFLGFAKAFYSRRAQKDGRSK